MDDREKPSWVAGDKSKRQQGDIVTLEAFITRNWQILTIFGVFAGFTNYMTSTANTALITLGFLLTFLVELEILQLLVKTKNMSLLLRIFTLLSALFILIFAGFIYSNHLSDLFSAFGVVVYPILYANRILLGRILFSISLIILALGLYSHLRPFLVLTMSWLGVSDRRILAMFILFIVTFSAATGMYLSPPPAPAPTVIKMTTTTSTLAPMTTLTTISTTTSTTLSTTTTTIPPFVACVTNSDCGNQTISRICYRGDVYLQKSTPICQKPDTPEARCIFKTSLDGESITSPASPVEKCSRRCEDGECV